MPAANNTSGNIYDNNKISSSATNLSVSVRQQKLEEEMVDNPVFGKNTFRNIDDINDYELQSRSIKACQIIKNIVNFNFIQS